MLPPYHMALTDLRGPGQSSWIASEQLASETLVGSVDSPLVETTLARSDTT
jgi:hypothetical protein